ncbi:MAG TPA: hypothetical protein PK655_04205 [archaeon]|jgi:hypothetical protein|nr:hypothetical protein [archaeon]
MVIEVKIECEQCKKKIVTSGVSYKGKWFCSLKCLKDYKATKQTE